MYRGVSMYKVVTKRFLNDAKTICLFEIEAPLAARHAQAGQFVIFRLDEQGERFINLFHSVHSIFEGACSQGLIYIWKTIPL